MPSAANAKSEKAASSEATDNSPIRQIMTIIEHKIRNLEKRKSKLTSYRDLQKAGKELNSDQKVAVAKYDEVAQTLEFARDFSKQVSSIAVVAEREAKKQAKKEAWVRYASDTAKIREVLLILDCLNQMGSSEAREDFLKGNNGACKLTEEDLKVLDDLYPEVTPKHEVVEDGQPGFHIHTTKAAEHLYAIIDGKPKEVLGTTYAHIKEVIMAVHECGYFDKGAEPVAGDESSGVAGAGSEGCDLHDEPEPEPEPAAYAPVPAPLPAPAYPLCPLPPITLQEVEHAYFSQQYPQQRPIAEVIGSQNFFFLQESEIDSPADTPQPLLQPSPPGPAPPAAPAPAPIPSQTFTNQHFVQLPSAPHFPPPPELSAFPPVLAPLPPAALHAPPEPQPLPPHQPPHHPHPPPHQPEPADDRKPPETDDDKQDDDWRESRSPERADAGERKTGQGDGQPRYRRYGRGGRGAPNGFRGRGGGFQTRQGGDYHGRHAGADNYQSRSGKDDRYDKPNRQYSDNYQNRHGKDNNYQSRGGADAYYGNGDTTESPQQNENGGRDRDRYNDNQNYQGGFKGRGRGGGRGARGGPRPPRPHQYSRKPDNVE